MRSRGSLVLALVASALLPAVARADVPPAPQPRPVIGFANQNPAMFDDPRFLALGIRQARINVPWDVLQEPSTLARLDAWMDGARRRGVTPLLTIDRSRRPGMQSVDPTAAMMATQVRAWRERWPGQVRQLSTWNEGNINKRPELVAQWYRAILEACLGCTVLGVDLVDRSNAVSWARRFVKAAGRAPAVWGLHNYIDANTFTTTNTRRFLKGVPGRIWLTETGGVVKRASNAVRFAGKGPLHAGIAMEFLLRYLAPLDRKRIERAYLYSWSTGVADRTWDSGLIGPDGSERPALRVVRCYLKGCKSRGPILMPGADPALPRPR